MCACSKFEIQEKVGRGPGIKKDMKLGDRGADRLIKGATTTTTTTTTTTSNIVTGSGVDLDAAAAPQNISAVDVLAAEKALDQVIPDFSRLFRHFLFHALSEPHTKSRPLHNSKVMSHLKF